MEKKSLISPESKSPNGVFAYNPAQNPVNSESILIQPPVISLSKGGGIKNIGEHFQVNSSDGATSFLIPFPLPLGREGFNPIIAYNPSFKTLVNKLHSI